MKLSIIIFMFVISGCSDANEDYKSKTKSDVCELSFKSTGPCVYEDVTVNLDVKKVATDEKLLQRIKFKF